MGLLDGQLRVRTPYGVDQGPRVSPVNDTPQLPRPFQEESPSSGA